VAIPCTFLWPATHTTYKLILLQYQNWRHRRIGKTLIVSRDTHVKYIGTAARFTQLPGEAWKATASAAFLVVSAFS
jgi:hypothetical protein